MNKISEEKLENAVVLFKRGKSIRFVASEIGIAKETAHQIQKLVHIFNLNEKGFTSVMRGFYGKEKNFLPVYKFEYDLRQSWLNSKYLKKNYEERQLYKVSKKEYIEFLRFQLAELDKKIASVESDICTLIK